MAIPFRSGRSERIESGDLRTQRVGNASAVIARRFFGASTVVFKKAKVNSTLVPSTQVNFPSYINLNRLGVTSLIEAQSIRVYSNISKTIELAREIVSPTEMWVKIPSLTSTTEIFVEYDGYRPDYAETATYGRNNVWSDYSGVYHLPEGYGARTDSAGNDNLTDINTVPGVAGRVGSDGANFTRANSERLETVTANVSLGDIPLEMALWHKTSLASTYRVISSLVIASSFGGSNRSFFEVQINNADNKLYTEFAIQGGPGIAANTTPTVNDGAWHHYVIKVQNTGGVAQIKLYMDGTLVMTSNHASLPYSLPANFTSYTLGATRNYADGLYTHYVTGESDEARLRASTATSDSWTTTEFNNQSNEASFWGTWATPAGAAFSIQLSETINTLDNFTRSSTRVFLEAITYADTFLKQSGRTLADTFLNTDTVLRQTARNFVETITNSDMLAAVKTYLKNLNESIAVNDLLSRYVIKPLTDAILYSDTIIRQSRKAITETIFLSDVLLRQITRTLVEAVSANDTIQSVKTFIKTLNENVSLSDLVARYIQKPLAETITYTDSIIRQLSRAISEVINLTDTLARFRLILRTLIETVNSTDSLSRQTSRILSEIATVSDFVVKQVTKPLTESTAITDTLTAFKAFLKTLTESISMPDILARFIGKPLGEVATYTDSVVKASPRTILNTVAITDTLQAVKTYLKALFESVTNTDTLTKHTSRALNELYALTDSIAKQLAKVILNSTALNDTLQASKFFLKTIVETVTTGDFLSKQSQKPLAETVLPADTVAKRTSRSIGETVSAVDSVNKQTQKTRIESVSLTDIIGKTFGRALFEGLTFVDTIQKSIGKTVLNGLVLFDFFASLSSRTDITDPYCQSYPTNTRMTSPFAPSVSLVVKAPTPYSLKTSTQARPPKQC